MSTRARIGIVNANGSVASIYTHRDGYVSHHGPILLNHYNTPAKIRKLLKLGNLSQLGDTPETCDAYMRDRGETDCTAAVSATLNEFEAIDCDEEYNYLFRDSRWEVAEVPRLGYHVWKDLLCATITERLTS